LGLPDMGPLPMELLLGVGVAVLVVGLLIISMVVKKLRWDHSFIYPYVKYI
jgi:hypothetical protein